MLGHGVAIYFEHSKSYGEGKAESETLPGLSAVPVPISAMPTMTYEVPGFQAFDKAVASAV